MGAFGAVNRIGNRLLGPSWRLGKFVPGIILIAACALGLEYIGVHTGAYAYGDFPIKLFGVPLGILGLWTAVGGMSWYVSRHRGILAGVLTGVLVDTLVLEPLAFTLHWWWWTSDFTPHLGMFGTVGNLIAWTGMTLLSVVVLRRNDSVPIAEGEGTASFVTRALVVIPLGNRHR